MLDLARVEAAFTADYIDYMAEWARRIEGEIIQSDRPGENIFLFRQPMGVVAGILPWNFPFFLIARKLAPALITGNTIVIKPSRGDAQQRGPVREAGHRDRAAARRLQHGLRPRRHHGPRADRCIPTCKMVSFTGSVETGSKIMADAAKNITKVNLELGGKAPAIVVADADLDLAAKLDQGVAHAQHRAGLQRARAGLCRPQDRRPVRREAGGRDEVDPLRRSLGRQADRHGADHQQGRRRPRSRTWSTVRWRRARRP